MTCNKSILADHDGKPYVLVFRDTVCLHHIIIGLLVILRIDLNPSGISCAHTVRMIAVDIDRPRKRTIHQRQRQRQTIGSRYV